MGRGAETPRTAIVKDVKDVNNHFENNSHKGRGTRVTIPEVFKKRVYAHLKQSKQNVQFNMESDEENLTPTKRKLVQNSNTQTVLRIFKQYMDEPPG